MKILVIKPSSLGDIIHGLQVVESIRVQSSGLHITWVVESAFADVVEACSTVDEILIFERRGGLREFSRLLRQIRGGDFDTVLDLQGLARSGLMTFAARAERKIGRADAREGAGWFYHQKIPLLEKKEAHAVEILAECLPLFDLPKQLAGKLRFEFSETSGTAPLSHPQGSVLVFPESRRREKVWPDFPEFLRKAARKYREQNFLWCASARSEAICPFEANIKNLAGKTDLRQIIELIQNAALIVANDSGPVHIAAAVGTPVLGLYGPTSPSAYGPYPLDHPRHHTIYSEDGKMASISVDPVLHALEGIL